MKHDPRTAKLNRCKIAVWALIAPLLCVAPASSAELARSERVLTEYVEPTEPAHRPFYDLLRQRQALERVRDVLAAVRWPEQLRLELRGCDGVSNAWYQETTITVCYEYLDEIWQRANSSGRPASVSREDAFVGPFAEVFLHEASHALCEQFQIPLLGREEDAADQVAAYHLLQLPRDMKRNLILGIAWSYASKLNVSKPGDLYRRRLKVGRLTTFADEHSAPAQRLFNLLCTAYGADKDLFADLVDKGFLPRQRAEFCEDDYRQLEFAYQTLIAPHTDASR